MTNEEAINVLRGQESAYWDTLAEAEHKAFDLAINALTLLKEQEPAEPEFLHGDWICAKCSAVVCWYTVKPSGYIEKNMAKYCPQCGQPVKWE